MDIEKDLKLIKKSSWSDVFNVWRENEDYPGSHWILLWQERGFKSWEDWRETYVERLGLKQLEWGFYEIIEPMQTVPQFGGGPFRSWVERFYQGKDNPLFSELAFLPEIQTHQGIINLMNDFPPETVITGVILNDKVIIVEGMHRCAAIALAAHLGLKIKTKMLICLATHHLDKLPVVGQNS